MSTYRQLKQQIAELEKKASIAMKTEVKKVIESIKKQIAEFGLTAADLGLEVARRAGAKVPRARRSVLKPKYRDPVTGKTWNGHGKRPQWIVAAQAKGKVEDLLIEKPVRAKPAKTTARPAARRATKAASAAAAPAAKAATKKPAKKAASKAPAKAPTKAKGPATKKRAAPKAAARKPVPAKGTAPDATAAPPAMPAAAPAAA